MSANLENSVVATGLEKVSFHSNLKERQCQRMLKLSHNCTRLTRYAKSFESRPTLCDPIDGSPPGSPVPGILQARTLKWVAISFSSVWKWKVKVKSLSCVRLFAIPWTAAYQAPSSMGFSRQEYWSGVPLPSLPFLKPAWTSGRSRFTYCWSLAWRILSIISLACEMSAIVW